MKGIVIEGESKKYKRPNSRTWIIINVIFPLIPFFLGGIIRFLAKGYDISWDTFNVATLAMSIGLLCVFVNQSLLTTKRPLSDPEEIEDIHGTATLFLIFAIFGFVFFAILIVLTALADNLNIPYNEINIHAFEVITLILSIATIYLAVKTQRSYKLRACI